MKEQWFAGVLQKYEADKGTTNYRNVIMWDNNRKPGNRYYPTRKDAEKALAHAYEIWNGVKQYRADGTREKLVDAVNGIGVSMVIDRRTDESMRIVKHIIQKRMVTEWETVEEE